MRFSERIGIKKVRDSLQIESVDEILKNKLWNLILNTLFKKLEKVEGQKVCNLIWTEFFNQKLDEVPRYKTQFDVNFQEYLKKYFFKFRWFEIYDFLEFVLLLDVSGLNIDFQTKCNFVLKREMSGYRLVDSKVIQTTSEEEISSIEEAISDSSKMNSVNTHLKASLEMLSNRKKPDYRNSIKEAISAVEAICKIIVGDENATLGNALSVIEKKYVLHGALKKAFSALYGFTNDAGGIRHALLKKDVKVNFEDAKFMLVSCSAFINYLQEKVK